jgi:hypothetical protein
MSLKKLYQMLEDFYKNNETFIKIVISLKKGKINEKKFFLKKRKKKVSIKNFDFSKFKYG